MGLFKKIKKGFKKLTGQDKIQQGQEAAKQAAEQQRRIVRAQNIRDRRKVAAQVRQQQAQSQIAELATGAESSGFAGVESAIAAEGASNIGFQLGLENIDAQRFALELRAQKKFAKGRQRGATFQAGAQLIGATVGAAVGGPGGALAGAQAGSQIGGQVGQTITAVSA